ncbi:MAG: zinc ribbon domain-containing protein [Anaerolineales bacterium]|nr:zinc ribbon domain-containing protein [Anaerolineales bacterium]
MKCPTCASQVLPEYSWCPRCGSALRAYPCRYCGQTIRPGEQVCAFCGAPAAR